MTSFATIAHSPPRRSGRRSRSSEHEDLRSLLERMQKPALIIHGPPEGRKAPDRFSIIGFVPLDERALQDDFTAVQLRELERDLRITRQRYSRDVARFTVALSELQSELRSLKHRIGVDSPRSSGQIASNALKEIVHLATRTASEVFSGAAVDDAEVEDADPYDDPFTACYVTVRVRLDLEGMDPERLANQDSEFYRKLAKRLTPDASAKVQVRLILCPI